MSLNRKQVRMLILEELETMTELQEFSESKGGKAFVKEGEKIMSSGKKIYEIGSNHTGTARKTIHRVAKFIHEMGSVLSGINDINENESVTDKFPSVSEYKNLIKAMKKLGG